MNGDVCRARVPNNVGQCFLEDAEKRRRNVGFQLRLADSGVDLTFYSGPGLKH